MKLRDHTHALIRRTCPPGADRLLEPPVPDPGSSAAPRAPAAPLHNGKEHTHGEAPARRPALTKEKEL